MPVKINIEAFNNYVKALEEFSRSNLISSETNTRRKLIDPLLGSLGWDIESNEVILEYPIRIGTRTSYVDFALSIDGKPIVFIEAKAHNTRLSEDYSTQIISYGRVEGVRWVALTNGKKIKIFDTRTGKIEKECIICEIDLNHPTHYIEELTLLHKESLLTGDIEIIAKRLIENRNAIAKIKEKQNELVNGYRDVIISIVGDINKSRISQVSSQLAMKTLELFEKRIKEKIVEETQPDKEKKKRQKWDDRLKWTNPTIKESALTIKHHIENNFKDVIHGITGTDYYFCKRKKGNTYAFAILSLRKNNLMIRVRFDPATSTDPNKLLKKKVYSWFFIGNGQEREFRIDRKNQIENAVTLIKQSYDLVN